MTVSMTGELLFLLASFVFGVCTGGAYDVLRIGRMLMGVRYAGAPYRNFSAVSLPLIGRRTAMRYCRKERRALLFFPVLLGDVFFFLLLGIAYPVFLYAVHSGVFRLYSLLALFFGFLLYRQSVGRAVLFLSSYIIFALRALCDYLWFFVFHPLGLLFGILFRVGKRICGGIHACSRHICAIIANTIYQRNAFPRRLRLIGKAAKGDCPNAYDAKKRK